MGEPGKTARQIQYDQHEDEADDRPPSFGKTFGLADRGGNNVDQDGADTGARIDARPPTAAQTTMLIEKLRSMNVGEANSAATT